MEVNVDVLEQMDLMDISDQEALDVFLNSGSEEGPLASPGLGIQSHMNAYSYFKPPSSIPELDLKQESTNLAVPPKTTRGQFQMILDKTLNLNPLHINLF